MFWSCSRLSSGAARNSQLFGKPIPRVVKTMLTSKYGPNQEGQEDLGVLLWDPALDQSEAGLLLLKPVKTGVNSWGSIASCY